MKLAEKFNDTKSYVYSNSSFSINSSGEKMPHVNKEVLFHHCARLNPTNTCRIARDEEHLKGKMKDLKTSFSIAYSNYNKSSFHDVEDPDNEFWKFCNGDITLLYAFTVWSHMNVTQLGKMLSDETSFDSTVNGTPNATNAHKVKKRRHSDTPSSTNSD